MNRLATETNRKAKRMPAVVARLDLEDADQHRLHGLIQRMHSGRWPTLRALAVKQQKDGTIMEAAEWVREKRERFAVVEWSTRGGRLAWRCKPMKTAREAISGLRAG